MKIRIVGILQAVLLLTTTTTSVADTATETADTNREPEPDKEERELIIDGEFVGIGRFPYFAQFNNGRCGGTLISSNRVLTSAQCVSEEFGGVPSSLRLGATPASTGVSVDVTCAKIYPDYLRTEVAVFNDIAVLKLATSVSSVTPVKLNTNFTNPSVAGQQLTILGFGDTGMGGPSPVLRKASVLFVETRDCQDIYNIGWEPVIQTSQHLCADSVAPSNAGICTGDQGGPLLDDATKHQVGVASFIPGRTCGRRGYPDVFVDVVTYTGWINLQKTDDTCTAGPPTPTAPMPTFPPTIGFLASPTRLPTKAPTRKPSPAPTATPTKAPVAATPVASPCFLDNVWAAVEATLKVFDNMIGRS